MANTGETAMAQCVLTSVPGAFDRWSHRRFTAKERRGARARGRHPFDPSLHSELLASELQSVLFVQHHALFFAELRIGAQTRAGSRSIAGAVRGSSVGVNRLVERTMRPLGRGRRYIRRMHAGVGNPLPSWRKARVLLRRTGRRVGPPEPRSDGGATAPLEHPAGDRPAGHRRAMRAWPSRATRTATSASCV
jgi:hypothetical protein